MLACDFFHCGDDRSQTIHVLFFIEQRSRRIHQAGYTANPNTSWVTQQARQLTWELEDESQDKAYLIRDNDKKFSSAFDTVFTSQGIEIVKTPYRAPRANEFAERWVRSVRQECLDQILIVNERHLLRVLQESTAYYGQARPHQGICQHFPFQIPSGAQRAPFVGATCLDVLSMTTSASPQPWFQAADSIFTGYRL